MAAVTMLLVLAAVTPLCGRWQASAATQPHEDAAGSWDDIPDPELGSQTQTQTQGSSAAYRYLLPNPPPRSRRPRSGDQAVGDAVVQIGPASVMGLRVDVQGKTVHRYLGIRYAQPPTGPRRFRPPVPVDMPGEVDATRYGARCPQHPLRGTGMSEDCLFLNVYTPAEPGAGHDSPGPGEPGADYDTPESEEPEVERLRSVLVFIHGGGFVVGSADAMEADELAAEGDIVVVTFNYRLGALGFLSTGDNSSLGNYGLWDQRLALQWVQKHIRYFGGDERRVTLAGMSAGAASAAILSLSPLARHLFRHVIQLSGAASSPWARVSQQEALHRALMLGRRLGCGGNQQASHNITTASLVDCLRQQELERIVSVSNVLFPRHIALSLVDYTWVPVRDRVLVTDMDGVTSFAGPLLAGLVENEGDIMYNWNVPRVAHAISTKELLGRRQFYRQHLLPTLLKQAYPELVPAPYPSSDLTPRDHLPGSSMYSALSTLECAYLNVPAQPAAASPGRQEAEGKDQAVGSGAVAEVFGDQAFYLGTVRHLRQFCSYQPSFLYQLRHQTTRPGVTGMRHLDDLALLFGFNTTLARRFLGFQNHVTDLDLRLARDFRQLIVNFIKTGDPNNPERPRTWPLWPPYTAKGADYLVASIAPRVASHLKADRMELWTKELPRLLSAVNANVSAKFQCQDVSPSARVLARPAMLVMVWIAIVFVELAYMRL